MPEISLAALSAQLFTGLVLGMIFVLLAIGLSLIFGLMTVVNFSHGSFYMLGAYLGFSLVSANRTSAVLRRDDAQIGLAVNGRDPERASCYFPVSDVDALWRELSAKGVEPGAIDVQVYEGDRYRVFFAKEPYGVCFCFGQPA